MKAKLYAALLCLLICLPLFGCSESTKSLGNDRTVPLDRIVSALQEKDTHTYLSAFPADFVSRYREQFPDPENMVQTLLSVADTVNRDRCGETYSVYYTLTAQEEADKDGLDDAFWYDGPDLFQYTLPADRIDAVYRVTVTVTFSGSFSDQTEECEFTVLRMGETWYLHPKHFGTVLHTNAT